MKKFMPDTHASHEAIRKYADGELSIDGIAEDRLAHHRPVTKTQAERQLRFNATDGFSDEAHAEWGRMKRHFPQAAAAGVFSDEAYDEARLNAIRNRDNARIDGLFYASGKKVGDPVDEGEAYTPEEWYDGSWDNAIRALEGE